MTNANAPRTIKTSPKDPATGRVSKTKRAALINRVASEKTRRLAEKGGAKDGRKNSVEQKPGLIKKAVSAMMSIFSSRPESQMTSVEKMDITRRGVSKKALEELKLKTGFDYDKLAEVLGVARTTLINKKGAEKFSLDLSEKIMSLADLYSFGYEIFGDADEFNQWILDPLPALGGQAPFALLNNQFGREEVKSLIGRIAYGAHS